MFSFISLKLRLLGQVAAGPDGGFATLPAPNGRMDGWKMREKGIAQLTPLARHLTPPISGWNEREGASGGDEGRKEERWMVVGRLHVRGPPFVMSTISLDVLTPSFLVSTGDREACLHSLPFCTALTSLAADIVNGSPLGRCSRPVR